MPQMTHTALHPFVRKVAHALRRRCGIRRDARLVLAVSGGRDSVALTAAVAALAPRRGWHLVPTVAHVQHHLRENGEAIEHYNRRIAGDGVFGSEFRRY